MIDVRELFINYNKLEEHFTERVSNVVIYAKGSLNYNDAWGLSLKELESLEKVVVDFLKLSSKSMGLI